MQIAGKRVFLTGGSRGIGRAIAEALLAKGAKVLFCNINAATGRATESALQNQYGADNVMFQQCDVTNADHMKRAFDTAVSRFGAVDICCNNAGLVDEGDWEKVIAINAVGQIRGSQLALEHMRRDRGGRGGVIVNVASVTGLVSCYNIPVYAATKHAIVGYTSSNAASPYQRQQDVRWCTLCPVGVYTDLISFRGQVTDKDKLRAWLDGFGILQPEDVAGAFIRLVQDETNNGAIMEVTPKFKDGRYRVRMIVDEDGVSDPLFVDRPLVP